MFAHRPSRTSNCIYLTFVMLAVFAPLTLVSGQSEIKWEVVNPFHFIRDQDAIDELREVYAEGNSTARALERALQGRDEDRVTKRRKEFEARCVSISDEKEKRRCENRAKLPYLGWFSKLARNNHAGTCWDSSALEFRDEDGCEDYIKAEYHRVRLWIENPSSTDFRRWQWELNQTTGEPKQCNPKYRKDVCIEFRVKAQVPTPVVATGPDGERFASTVNVNDILIVGMGDSFAAGEGNPDMPAQFLERQSETDYVWFWKFRRSARRDLVDQDVGGLAEVAWLDKRCHRSMYSYQFKAALQYALENPQKSVTFASVSCSGAEIPELLTQRQKPKERMLGATVYQTVGDRKTIRPQIAVLHELLASRPPERGIDYLLLSIGGNDAGFAKYVAYVMLSGRTLWLAKNFKEFARKPKEETILKDIKKLEDDYRRLNAALLTLPIRSKDPRRIILTGYPDFVSDGKKNVCAVNRDEFTVPFNRDDDRGRRLGALYSMVYMRLYELQKDPSRIPWTPAEPDNKSWAGHAFCAQGDITSKDRSKVQERFIMPKRKKGDWYSIEPRCDSGSTVAGDCDKRRYFDPREYKTYGERARWIRLPVDSKLSVDQQETLWLFSFDLMFTDDWSTVMHPTAEGFAVNADATLKAMNRVVKWRTDSETRNVK